MTETRFAKFFAILITVLLLTGCASPAIVAPTPTATTPPTVAPTATPLPARFETAKCMFDTSALSGKIDCGYLTVPEDRAQPGGRMIQLAVAILRSSSAHPAPDPLVYLAGGAGGSMLNTAGMVSLQAIFGGILASRDVIVFDQRGTGNSSPSLNCPEVEVETYQDLTQTLSQTDLQQNYLQAVRACHDRLVAQGINFAAYTSAASAADVNDLRRSLGYAQWNLYGISYGTRLALTIMRDFPQGVRSVMLDSVYPPQVDGPAGQASNAERAFNLLFQSCAADAGCNAAYPDLKTVFYATVAQLDAKPMAISMVRPNGQQSYTILVNGNVLINLLFNLLYDTPALPYLPQFIYSLHAGQWVSGFQAAASNIFFADDYISEGVNFSLLCGEDIPFTSQQAVATANAPVLPRLQQALDRQSFFAACSVWSVKPAAAIENQPVVSAIPTLVLAGDNDPVTPPAWSKAAANTLSHSYYFEFPWVGHGILGAGVWGSCSKSMAAAFLADPNAAPDSTCMSDLKVFFVTK
jgi:pimeloyl-ACP methyl ester carboxylesterase